MDESQLVDNAGHHDIVNSNDDTSMLIKDANAIEEENGLVFKNSTPVVKMRSSIKDDSSKDTNSDLSALSSVSGEVNGRHDVAPKRNEGGSNVAGLELELKYEFESKASKRGSRSRNKNQSRDRRERQQHDAFGRRDLVISARGNSQTDLAGSGGGSREKEESCSVEPHRGMNVRSS